MPTPRKPDYTLSVMDKETGRKNPNIGGAWKNPDGSLFISLNPCVVLSGDKNLAIALFPANNTPQSSPQRLAGKPKSLPAFEDEGSFHSDDEIPY